MSYSNRKLSLFVGLLALAALTAPRGHAQSSTLPVFPGAQGFGTQTRAGYGGSVAPTIYRVTNLNDSGAGSFRAAAEASGPRVVIFETSGTILLNSPVRVISPYLTVAGQTAPSPGITFRRWGIETHTHDVLYQHFRVRPGDIGPAGGTGMGLEYTDAYNVVFAQLSLSWCNDESLDASTSHDDANVTFWRVLVAEALNFSTRWPGDWGHGMLGDGSPKKVALLQSVMASNGIRNPYFKGGSQYVANNLVYNWTDQATAYGPSDEGGGIAATHIGNVYRTGPDTQNSVAVGVRGLPGGSQLYLTDTKIDDNHGSGYVGDFQVIAGEGVDPRVSFLPLSLPNYAPMSSNQVQDFVLTHAGARPADRDSVDTRIVQTIQTRTGGQISSQAEVGGWPTLAVNTRPLTLPSNPHTATSSGYTNLEIWLHGFAAAVETGQAAGAPLAPTGLHIVSN